MINKLKKTFLQEKFYGRKNKRSFFGGRYFNIISTNEKVPIAMIPGIFQDESNKYLKNLSFIRGQGSLMITLLLILFLLSCNIKSTDKFAMDTLADLFERETGIPTNIITGSSGKLTAQILQGAPFDVFLSADMKYPEQIYRSGKALKAPEVYAYGSLILWTLKDDIQPDIDILTSDKITRIAIANPKTAPYGVASIEFLKRMSIYEMVKDKLIFGESISQVNQFITSRSADIGFSAESVVLSSTLPDKGLWIRLDNTKYTPLKQGIVIINRENGKSVEAENFFLFLLSPRAKNILSEFGYKTRFPE